MLKKRKLKSNVRVTFIFPAELHAESVHLLGDFNAWDKSATPLAKNEDGYWETRLDLEPGRQFQFKYLVNQQIWRNDLEADAHVGNPFGTQNSVVTTTLAGRAEHR
jgi:1,4-alpha-glucan branching enzyme